MEIQEEMWGYLLSRGFGVLPAASSPGPKKLVERDLLSLMEEYNYENSGVDVSLNICTPDPAALAIKQCTSCQETSTPLWRNGPAGPKTLCNACGIRHRKEMSKINTDLTLGRTPDLQPNVGSARANKNNRA